VRNIEFLFCAVVATLQKSNVNRRSRRKWSVWATVPNKIRSSY